MIIVNNIDHGHLNVPTLSRDDRAKIHGFNYRVTELQGAIGKVQLKKLRTLLSDNKKKYNTLKKILEKNFIIRKIHENSVPNYDTFIFFEKNNRRKIKIINLLNRFGIGTKNLPDAIKWHCSYYWKHCLPKKEIINSITTKEKLKQAIAIPINYKINNIEYKKLAQKIIDIK